MINSRLAVAIHILSLISMDEKTSSEIIADSVNTNPVVVRRMISLLKKADILTSRAGVPGASLKKDPADISLLEVYRAVQKQEELFAVIFFFLSISTLRIYQPKPCNHCKTGYKTGALDSNITPFFLKSSFFFTNIPPQMLSQTGLLPEIKMVDTPKDRQFCTNQFCFFSEIGDVAKHILIPADH